MKKNDKYVTWDIQKRIIAFMTTQGWKTTPHASYNYEANVSEFFALYRKIVKQRAPERKFTFNSLMMKAIAVALREVPEMNAHFFYNKYTGKCKLEIIEDINISMPTIMPNGRMMALNIKNCESKNVDEISDFIKDLRGRCETSNLKQVMSELSVTDTLREGVLGHPLQSLLKTIGSQTVGERLKFDKPKEVLKHWKTPLTERISYKELQLGTISVSNFGSVYTKMRGTSGVVDIIPNFTTALVIGSVQDKPAVIDGEIVPIKMLPLGIVYDSRVLNPVKIDPFVGKLIEIFENPEIIYTWLEEESKTIVQIEEDTTNKEMLDKPVMA